MNAVKYWLIDETVHSGAHTYIESHYIMESICGEYAIVAHVTDYFNVLIFRIYNAFDIKDPYDWLSERELQQITLEKICILNSEFGLILFKNIDVVEEMPLSFGGSQIGIKKDIFLNDIVPKMVMIEQFLY